MTVVKFKNSLSYYLKLFDKRKIDGDMLGALDAGRNAIKHAKTKIDRNSVNMLLGEVYFDMGLYLLSCEHYFRAVDVAQTRAGAYFGVARNLVFLNRFNLSLDYFEKVLEWDSYNIFSQAVFDWIEFLKEQLDIKQKEDLSEKTIEKSLKCKNYKQALDFCEKLLQKNPDDNNVLCLYAKCLLFCGDVNKSRQILKTILQDDSSCCSAILLLASISLLDEDLTSFFTLINQIDKEKLNDSQLLFYAKLLADNFLFNEAIECLEKLSQKKPYSTKIYLFLGICYHNKGDKETALLNLSKARWIDFENPTLMEYYKLFNSSNEIFSLTDDIPKTLEQQKLEKLKQKLSNEDFVANWLGFAMMEDETDWLVSTKHFEEGEMLANHFGHSKNKRIKKYCRKVLLSVRPNLKQKFLLTREILRGQKHKCVELTANLTFRSFSLKLSKSLNCIALFRNSITNAWAYVQCYANKCNILKTAENLFKIILENNLENKIEENVLTCLIFSNETKEFHNVCTYFAVDEGEVENAKYLLKIN